MTGKPVAFAALTLTALSASLLLDPHLGGVLQLDCADDGGA